MFCLAKVVHVVVGALLFLASGIAVSAVITLTPLAPTNVPPGLSGVAL